MGEGYVGAQRQVAGRYRLLDVVQRETDRVCWSGEDVEAGRPCLLTEVRLPEAVGEDGVRRLVGRVVRTSETLERLCPGRVAPVLDAVVEAGALWTVTDWVGGTPLGELLAERGTFHYVRAARIGLELLEVLDAAHGEGVTHGELSPGQVIVPERGPVVVTGFGLAGATLAPRLTAPSYASPEQARDERIGPAADLWALGAILYTLVEGRPPFRDRDRPESTLRGVDRLPVRTPVRAGPLAQVVLGLLRKDSRERLTRPVARVALTRVLREDPDAAAPAAPPAPRLHRACTAACQAAPRWSRRTMVAGTALAVVTVALAVLAATRQLPGAGPAASEARARPTAPGSPVTGGPVTGGTPPVSPDPGTPSGTTTPSDPDGRSPATTPSPSSPPEPTGLPQGFRTYAAPEGFSVAVPDGWRPVRTTRVSDLAYRVVLGADGDDRTLAVTYSARVGPDPVAVWREDVEPGLVAAGGYRRLGAIRPTTYQGREAADMEWTATLRGTRVRTFGRGFLIGGGQGFSLRWTTPSADFDTAANRRALATALSTFRPPAA